MCPRVSLCDDAVDHIDDLVVTARRLGIVGDKQHGHLMLAIEASQQAEDFVRTFAVEIAGRLIRQQQRGIHCQRSRQCHVLLLAAAQIAGEIVLPFVLGVTK
jgi:hypothetical protein